MKHPKPEPRLCACSDHAFAVVDVKAGDNLHVAIVSPQDAPLLAAHRWRSYCPHFAISGDHRKDVYYLRRDSTANGRKRCLLFHREVMGVDDRHVIVDHREHNGLDCRRPNLRVGTHQKNRGNSRTNINNLSGYKGVSLHKRSGKWRASIGVSGYLGLFDCKHAAARAYNAAAMVRFGSFALLNVIEGDAA